MFTWRHYEALAEVIRVERKRAEGMTQAPAAISSVVEELADLFARDNPNFKREWWYQACQPRPTYQEADVRFV